MNYHHFLIFSKNALSSSSICDSSMYILVCDSTSLFLAIPIFLSCRLKQAQYRLKNPSPRKSWFMYLTDSMQRSHLSPWSSSPFMHLCIQTSLSTSQIYFPMWIFRDGSSSQFLTMQRRRENWLAFCSTSKPQTLLSVLNCFRIFFSYWSGMDMQVLPVSSSAVETANKGPSPMLTPLVLIEYEYPLLMGQYVNSSQNLSEFGAPKEISDLWCSWKLRLTPKEQ